QSPIEGTSILPAIDDASHAEIHTTQYYEMFGCRAIYHEGYKAVTYHQIHVDEPGLDTIEWELYDVRVDPSECHDLATELPDKVAELDALFWREAEAHHVLPLDNRPFSEFTVNTPREPRERTITVLLPGGGEIPEQTAPDIKNRPHRVSAHVSTGDSPQGVLVSQGSVLGGWAFYVDDGKLVWHLNVARRRTTTISAPLDVEAGDHVFEFDYATEGNMTGVGQLYVDGALVATGEVGFYTPTRFTLTGAGLTVGRANALPVCDDRGAGVAFSGTIDRVVIALDGDQWSDPAADAEAAIAAQ
ncbi:MAG: hypothetical protein IH940_13905, partial [Acidobacteria bacterium]|nr:hypothetical protein [Acidobacteriota bacterium]